jgi:hypothetical protein
MTKIAAIGWSLCLVGTALWTYGYFVIDSPPLIDWRANTPWWIADFLRSIEAEIDVALAILAVVPIYWPIGIGRT